MQKQTNAAHERRRARILSALIIATVNCALYPLINYAATMERGYDAFGGEELLFALGFFAAWWILVDRPQHKKGARDETEDSYQPPQVE